MAEQGETKHGARGSERHTYAAIDLGTNNCRLLVARPAGAGFRVVDAFSRIVRLGEGVDGSLRLSAESMDRTMGPTTSKRKVTNVVVVRDEQPVVIGGLIRSSESEGLDKVPFLGG